MNEQKHKKKKYQLISDRLYGSCLDLMSDRCKANDDADLITY